VIDKWLFSFIFLLLKITFEGKYIFKKQSVSWRLSTIMQEMCIHKPSKCQDTGFIKIHNSFNKQFLNCSCWCFSSLSRNSCRAHINCYMPIKIHSPVLKLNFAT
jgi:hypothetical protein